MVEGTGSYQKEINDLAIECYKIYQAINLEGKASLYWSFGDTLFKFERRLVSEKDSKVLRKTDMLSRVSGLISGTATGDPSNRANIQGPSVRFMRATVSFRELCPRELVSDDVPWSIYFECLRLGKDLEAWKKYIDLYKSGEAKSREKNSRPYHRRERGRCGAKDKVCKNSKDQGATSQISNAPPRIGYRPDI